MGRTKTARYDGVAMMIHWVTAALMIFMVIFGEDLIKGGEEIEDGGAIAGGSFLPSLHVSIGLTILLLTLLRVVWRLAHQAPPYPASMKRYEVIASKSVHGIFYLLLIGLPLSGWLTFGGYAARHPEVAAASFYGLFGVPQPPITGRIFGEMHEIGSNIAMALIALHVLAALKHQFIDRDGIFKRMLPSGG